MTDCLVNDNCIARSYRRNNTARVTIYVKYGDNLYFKCLDLNTNIVNIKGKIPWRMKKMTVLSCWHLLQKSPNFNSASPKWTNVYYSFPGTKMYLIKLTRWVGVSIPTIVVSTVWFMASSFHNFDVKAPQMDADSKTVLRKNVRSKCYRYRSVCVWYVIYCTMSR